MQYGEAGDSSLGPDRMAGTSSAGRVCPHTLAQAAAPPERVLPDYHDLSAQAERCQNRSASRSGAASTASSGTTRPQGFPRRSRSEARRCLQGPQGADRRQLQRAPRAAARRPGDRRRSVATIPSCRSAGVLIADAGENQKKLEEVFDTREQAGRGGRRQGRQGTVQRPDAPYRSSPPRKTRRRTRRRRGRAPPARWSGPTRGASSFVGSDVEIVKDLTAHRDGRDNSLAATESFTKTLAKTDASKAQVGLVPRRRQDHQAGDQGQRQGQQGPGPADRGPGRGARASMASSRSAARFTLGPGTTTA